MKRLIISVMLLLTITLAAGCGSSSSQKNTAEESTKEDVIVLYYINSSEDGFETKRYHLSAKDSVSDACYEVMKQLFSSENVKKGGYHVLADKGLTYEISVMDNDVTVDFGTDYQKLNSSEEILMRTAIVKSLVQVPGVDTVTFTVNNKALMGSENSAIRQMTGEDFVTDSDNGLYSGEKQVTLYYVNKKGTELVPVKSTIHYSDNIPIEKQVLEELKSPPERDDIQAALPQDFVVQSTYLRGNVCYVDLSSPAKKRQEQLSGKIMLYAMVNTLTDLDDVMQVKFTVEGEKGGTISGFPSFDKMFVHDYSYYRNEVK